MSHSTSGRMIPPSMAVGRGRTTRERLSATHPMPLEGSTTTATSRRSMNNYSSGNGYHFSRSSYHEPTQEAYSYRDPTYFDRPDDSNHDYYEDRRQRVYPDSYPELPPHHQGMYSSSYRESSPRNLPYDAYADEVESQTGAPPIGMIRCLQRQPSTRSSLGSPSNHLRDFSSHSRGGPSTHSRREPSNHSRGGLQLTPTNNTHSRLMMRQTSTLSLVSSIHSSRNEQRRSMTIPDNGPLPRAPRDSIPQSPTPRPKIESDEDRPLIEVAPDLYMYLRGSDETIQAITEGAIIETICSCCDLVLHCVMHAEFVLCPVCRVVSPVSGRFGKIPRNGAGVGLGVKTETLLKVLQGT